jgi:hypothetical protein
VNLAQSYFKAGRISDARQQVEQARLGYSRPGIVDLELDWLDAEIMAAEGQVQQAAELGQKTLDSYLFQGLNGPGTTGSITKYAQQAFRRPVMAIEFVPWVQTIQLPDVWGQRMAKLASWDEQLGKADATTQVTQILLRDIPDFKNP